ncbi:MAG: response regulator [Bacteroidales bacterium]|nr:response regulator [Bacteroidales bacterium]
MKNLFQVSFENGHVLAVEDSLVQAKKIKYFFDQNDIPSVICSNGKEAYEAAKEKKPVLIISDIMMPVMDGYELCKKIKQDPELFDIPFILLTSLGDQLDIIKGLQAGADNFITKPYDSDYLLSRINYLIANRHIRKMGSGDMSIEIVFQNQKFLINSDKKQILDLLLSVYEAAVNKNTHLIEAQRQLEMMNENLNAANKELEAFSHTVSHDLKSPLNAVIGFADLLKIDYEGILDEDGQSYLDYIIQAGRNMAQLIEDLLAFSQSGRVEIVPKEINLSEMAASICKDLRAMNYVAQYDVKIDDGIIVNADPKMMHVALNNLIGNALKYSQKQAAPAIHIGSFESNGKNVIFVRDNGAGFDMQKADTLFRPFIRLHSNQEFQGTGVGLSTVKRVVERHGGAIWFESEPNKGATFYFTID